MEFEPSKKWARKDLAPVQLEHYKIAGSFGQRQFTAKEFKKRYRQRYGKTAPNSILPSDFAYNNDQEAKDDFPSFLEKMDRATYRFIGLVDPISDGGRNPNWSRAEHERRLALWRKIESLGISDLEPSVLRGFGVYGGAQGIWVDKAKTAKISPDGAGVTVSILHTGRHYPDELMEDGVIYHYPETNRPPSRDAGEVEATKNAGRFDLPIFVIMPGRSRQRHRSVRLGWVSDYDDETKQFLILFGTSKPDYGQAAMPDEPFKLEGDAPQRKTGAMTVRQGQQRFRFQVLSQYGCKCAVCAVGHARLIKAAHIRGKAEKGSDDWRNGLPLCGTHHDAFDAHLFLVDPQTLQIRISPEVEAQAIGIDVDRLQLKHDGRRPHQKALKWREQQTLRAWG